MMAMGAAGDTARGIASAVLSAAAVDILVLPIVSVSTDCFTNSTIGGKLFGTDIEYAWAVIK